MTESIRQRCIEAMSHAILRMPQGSGVEDCCSAALDAAFDILLEPDEAMSNAGGDMYWSDAATCFKAMIQSAKEG